MPRASSNSSTGWLALATTSVVGRQHALLVLRARAACCCLYSSSSTTTPVVLAVIVPSIICYPPNYSGSWWLGKPGVCLFALCGACVILITIVGEQRTGKRTSACASHSSRSHWLLLLVALWCGPHLVSADDDKIDNHHNYHWLLS